MVGSNLGGRFPVDAAGPTGGTPAPFVSVVIANYNRWPMLRQAIESVLAQSMSDLELIVVDDGSDDGSPDHVEAAFPGVRVVRQRNAERGAAYNRGIALARAPYVAFLDNDDVYAPGHLAAFRRAQALRPDGRVFAGRAAMWDPATGRRRPLPRWRPENVARHALVATVIPYQAMVVERGALLEVGGLPEDRALMGCDDWILLLRLARRWPVHPLAGTSVLIREHPGRSMWDLPAISASREEATRRILAGDRDLLGVDLDAAARRLVLAGTHRLTAAHRYAAGDMGGARASLREVRGVLGPARGATWTARLWAQTWMGPRVSVTVRRLRDRLLWR